MEKRGNLYGVRVGVYVLFSFVLSCFVYSLLFYFYNLFLRYLSLEMLSSLIKV